MPASIHVGGIVVNQNSAIVDSYSVLLGANVTITGRQNASITLGGTTIANAVQGIRCEDCASINATNTAIQASNQGIHVFGSNRDADVVYKNGFLQTDQTGILISHSGINASNVEIADNRPIRTGNNSIGLAFAAIMVSGSNHTGSTLKIVNNVITTLNTTHGIFLFQSPNGEVLNNDVTIHLVGNPESGFKARGISIWNSDGTDVKNNIIQDPLYNQFGQPVYNKYDESSTGIFMSFSRNCLVMDNTMNETVIGMKVAGFCDHPASSPFGVNNHIRNNSFVQPHVISQTPQLAGVDLRGLWYVPDAITGNQDCTGNQWYGEFVNGALCESNPLLSPYTVPSTSPPLMPPNVLPSFGWFETGFCKQAGERSNNEIEQLESVELTSNSIETIIIATNPVVDKLHVIIPVPTEFAVTIKITDLAGKLVFESSIPPVTPESILDVSSLETGIYFVHIKQGVFQRIEKIIVIN